MMAMMMLLLMPQVERMNDNHAIRNTDVIVLDERRRRKVKKAGKYRHWTVGAAQRACWGVQRESKRLALHFLVC